MRRQGFTLIEVLATVAVLVVGLTVVLGSFAIDLRQSSQTRAEMMAHVVMESLVEEAQAHHYGIPAPTTWNGSKVSFPTVVEGRRVETTFTTRVSVDPVKGNGSVMGSTPGSLDTLLLQVEWDEAAGPGARAVHRELKMNLSVAREL